MLYTHELKEKDTAPPENREKVPYPPVRRELLSIMERYLSGRSLSYETARLNLWYPGYYPSYDRTPRVVIPASNARGFPYFQARATRDHSKRYESPSFPRVDSLVVVWPWGTVKQKIVVVEGPLDALAAAGAGCLGISFMGACPTESQISHLIKIAKRQGVPVIIIPDMDSPELGPMLVSYLAQEKIKAEVRLPDAKDLAAMPPEERDELLKD